MRPSFAVAAAACAVAVSPPAGAASDATNVEPHAAATVAARPADEVLTLQEAATLLRVDALALERMSAQQQLPARRVGDEWRFSRNALFAWLAGSPGVFADAARDAATPRLVPSAPAPLSAQASARIVGRGETSATSAASADDRDRSRRRLGEAPQRRTASEVALREQRLLLARNELTWDIGAFYTRRDTTVLTSVGGNAVLANAESDAFTTQVIARYGLQRNTEIWASASYGDQRASLFSGAQRISRASRSEFGDIGLGLRQTLLEEGAGRPDVVVGLDARIPTGDTSPALGAAVSLIKSIDPVVLFGTLGYRHTFSREFDDIARLEASNRIDLTLGYSFALNDTLSVNSALVNSFARATRFSNAELRSTNASTLQLGMTARLAKGLYLQPSVGFRLNGPTRGYTLGVNVPITF